MEIVRDFSSRLRNIKSFKAPQLVYKVQIDAQGGDQENLEQRLAFVAGPAIGPIIDKIEQMLTWTDKEAEKRASAGRPKEAEGLVNNAKNAVQQLNRQAEESLQKAMQDEVNKWLKDNKDAKVAVRKAAGIVVLTALAGAFATGAGIAVAAATLGAGWPIAVALFSGAASAIAKTYSSYKKNFQSVAQLFGKVGELTLSVETERSKRNMILAACKKDSKGKAILSVGDKAKLTMMDKTGDTRNLGAALDKLDTQLKVLDKDLEDMRKNVINLVKGQDDAMKSLKSVTNPTAQTKEAEALLKGLEDRVKACLEFLDQQNKIIEDGRKTIPVTRKMQQDFLKSKQDTVLFNTKLVFKTLQLVDKFQEPIQAIITGVTTLAKL